MAIEDTEASRGPMLNATAVPLVGNDAFISAIEVRDHDEMDPLTFTPATPQQTSKKDCEPWKEMILDTMALKNVVDDGETVL